MSSAKRFPVSWPDLGQEEHNNYKVISPNTLDKVYNERYGVHMATTLDQIARQYLATKSAVESASAALKELEKQLKDEMLAQAITKYECSGKTISMVSAERRSFDAEALSKIISASMFRKITTVEVRAALVDAAVSLGELDMEALNGVITKTPYTQLKVN